MSKYKKTAKDISFENERAKNLKKIRELEYLVREKEFENQQLKEAILEKEKRIENLENQNASLLECLDMPAEDLLKVIDRDKAVAKLLNDLLGMNKLLSNNFLGKYL